MTNSKGGDTLTPMTDEARLVRAALYAGGVFLQMATADISDEDLASVTPVTPRDQNVARRAGVLALLLHASPTSRAAIRELLHRGESDLSDDELADVAYFVDGVASRLILNSGIREVVEFARRDVGAFTPGERRAAVLERLAGYADPEATRASAERCIADLARDERPFAALDPANVLDVLQRIDATNTKRGKRSDGSAWLRLTGAAAKLSTSVTAFGDENEHNAKRAFEDAAKSAATRLEEDKKLATAEISRIAKRRKRQGLP